MGSVLGEKGVHEVTETILLGAVLIFLGVREYFDRKERKDIYRLLMSKSVEEAALAEKITDIKTEDEEEQLPDEIPLATLSDEEWEKAVINNGEQK